MSTPTPQKPKPLEQSWLRQRSREPAWEDYHRASEDDLEKILDWAEQKMISIYMLEDMAGKDSKEAQALMDELYDTIRDSLTRQDLICGFLMHRNQEASMLAMAYKDEFAKQLRDLTGDA